MKNYILNLETNKIELHFEKEDYIKLSDELKKEIKSSYLFSKYSNAWVSRSTKDHYRAIQTALKLGFTAMERVGERLTYAEQLEVKAQKAENRSDRFNQYSENAIKRQENLQGGINSHHGDIAFFTQPNINSSGGRSFTNYREKLFNRYRKGFEEYKKSEYFKERAKTAQDTANMGQLEDKRYLDNRIREGKAIIRKLEKWIEIYKEPKTENEEKQSNRYLERFEEEMDKLGFFENCLENIGGVKFSKENIKAGDHVKIRGSWRQVMKANKVTLEVKSFAGIGLKYPYAEIKEHMTKEGADRIKEEKGAIEND